MHDLHAVQVHSQNTGWPELSLKLMSTLKGTDTAKIWVLLEQREVRNEPVLGRQAIEVIIEAQTNRSFSHQQANYRISSDQDFYFNYNTLSPRVVIHFLIHSGSNQKIKHLGYQCSTVTVQILHVYQLCQHLIFWTYVLHS